MFARSERLLLRPGWAEDAPALARAIADEAVVRNLATAPWPYSVGDAEAFLSREIDPRLPHCVITARTNGSPRLIGGIGIGNDPAGNVELGYWIARPYWGLGYATEAGRVFLEAVRGTLRHRNLVAGHFLDNPASGHVLRKLGFRPTGRTVQRFSLARGNTAACAIYAHAADTNRPDCDDDMRCLKAA